jgi:GntR family transcriptional regulator / MocR family aminotransferase
VGATRCEQDRHYGLRLDHYGHVMRKWNFLTAAIGPHRGAPLFLQLSNAIADDIKNGRLKPGDALPGTRVLAAHLGIHRNTVIAGYHELIVQGLARARRGGGTFVTARAKLPPRSAVRASPALPTYAMPSTPPPLPVIPPDPCGPLMLYRGSPDVRLLPAEALARAFHRALSRHGRKILGYGDPRGHERLRGQLATMLSHTRGLATSSENILITHGSQHALDLVARALLSPGDVVAVEELGLPAVWAALRLTGAELEPIPVDDDGLDVDALASLVRRRTLRAVYVTPHHQLPTTTIMSPARRARLAALAIERRFAIIEDDYDHEFHYEGAPLAPIAAGPGGANVIYLGTLSKVLAPALRVGYVVAPPSIIEPLVRLRAVSDMQGDTVVECAIAELFEDGEFVRHVRRMSQIYGRRRDALAEALARQLGGTLHYRVPEGGMALWARVEGEIDIAAWERAGETRGVLFRGAKLCDFLGRDQPFMRLGFTYHDEGELAEAASRMAQSLAELALAA